MHQTDMQALRLLFEERFGYAPRGAGVFASAPGRVELAGNHTDHQGGRVISAAVNLRARALAIPNGTRIIRLFMEGFGSAELDLDDAHALEPHADERGTSLALVRGMAALHARRGGTLEGFDMAVESCIPAGAGLSSSAAFEMLIGRSLEALCPASEEPLDPVLMALEGAHAEQIYFGKPCGAQDQIASAIGGAVAMDFSSNPPATHALAFDASTCEYALCLIDSRCDHSQFTEEFAAIPGDMRAVASLLGHDVLGQVDPSMFLEHLDRVRDALGDAAALRALHFFDETIRVAEQQRALEEGRFQDFLAHALLSGASSAQYLQNVSPHGNGSGAQQPAMVILALCAHILGRDGAWRIHGGGFGGGVLAFVPQQQVAAFKCSMNDALGYSACRIMEIDDKGAFAEKIRL
ncbi:MAG: galactokinase [Eggerthellaceae bacterium]|nr:galactokinase [Eggerthellaceae bacterium]